MFHVHQKVKNELGLSDEHLLRPSACWHASFLYELYLSDLKNIF